MRNPRSLAVFGLLFGATAAFAQSTAASAQSPGASAQSKVQWDSKYNIPVAPTGLAHRPLPDHPMVFDTAEGQNIRVVVVTKALEYPWSAVFFRMEACW